MHVLSVCLSDGVDVRLTNRKEGSHALTDAVQEINGVPVQYRSQCIEGVTFLCNGAQDNNCQDGQATVRQWQVAFYNFDNFGSSLLSVVEVAVMDNYMDDVAYFVMDATGRLSQAHTCHAYTLNW